MTRRTPAISRTERSQKGSAFIISLLVIIVITFLGLTLSMVTSTEMQLGGNDRDLQRSLYACQSGLAITAARVLVRQDALATGELRTPQVMEDGRPIQINEYSGSIDPKADASPARGSRVTLSYVASLNEGPAAYSEINGADGKQVLKRGIVGFQAWGYRYATTESPDLDTADTPLTMRICSTVLDLQPFKFPLNMYYMSSQAGSESGRTLVGTGKIYEP